jgi:Protein of unknown function (DUF2281)
MNSLTQEIAARAETLPEAKQQEALDFIKFLQAKFAKPVGHMSETALLSESALATDWNRPEEDEAWAKFQ